MSAQSVMRLACAFLGVAVASGVALYQARGWPIAVIGIPSLFLAYGYTGGPFPLAYRGMGELFVIGFFGIVAVTGFMLTSYTGNSTTDLGEWMELDAVAACVIGGVSLRGGRGTVLGVLAGALIMATLLNGMTLMAVSPEYKLMVRGSVLLAAVWMDVRLGRQ